MNNRLRKASLPAHGVFLSALAVLPMVAAYPPSHVSCINRFTLASCGPIAITKSSSELANRREPHELHNAGDAGTTRGIIDIRKTERPADAVTLVGPHGFNLVPEGMDAGNWDFKTGVITAPNAWDSLITKEPYGDIRMHVEFNVNEVKDVKDHETDGNSGVYIQQRYEIQILNSYGISEKEYKTIDCGSIYRQKKPDKLVCKKAGEWQSFDIVFKAARFDGQKKTENARITVYQNGQLIHDDFSITGKTGAGEKEGPQPRPIKLQGHHNPVRFRNVWVQRLSLD